MSPLPVYSPFPSFIIYKYYLEKFSSLNIITNKIIVFEKKNGY